MKAIFRIHISNPTVKKYNDLQKLIYIMSYKINQIIYFQFFCPWNPFKVLVTRSHGLFEMARNRMKMLWQLKINEEYEEINLYAYA